VVAYGHLGPGNFDSDDAVDYLSEVIRSFVDTVEQWFAQGRASLDDQGEGRLMPTVEMITVLCDWCRGGPPAIRVVAPPSPGVVRRWKQRYLEIYDAHIVRTFDRLEVLATDFCEEGPVTSS
jgi:hypothetical protein